MSKRITVTLTERQWDDVLYMIDHGMAHLDLMVDAGGDSSDVRKWESAIKRGEGIDTMIRQQIQEGGAK